MVVPPTEQNIAFYSLGGTNHQVAPPVE